MNPKTYNVLPLGVLASGRGSNLQAIFDAIEAGKLQAKVMIVISDKPDALALERARERNVPALFLDPSLFASRQDYDAQLVTILKEAGVEAVVLAGFMRIVTRPLLESFHHRVVNIHPSLLPAFKGLHGQRQALEYGVRFSGCTVHLVDEGMDTGPILLQAVVPVLPTDTEASLSTRILEQEHRLLPEALQLLAENRIVIEGRRVLIRESVVS